jgi:hypothetical protein
MNSVLPRRIFIDVDRLIRCRVARSSAGEAVIRFHFAEEKEDVEEAIVDVKCRCLRGVPCLGAGTDTVG